MADPAEVETDPEEETKPGKNWRRELEDRAKIAEEKATRLERELAFTKAGLDGLTDKQVKALAVTHEGAMTPEALLATAKDLGFTAEQPAPQPQAQPSGQVEQPDPHAGEVAEIGKLSGSPATTSSGPQDRGAELRDKLSNFDGDYQSFQAFVMANADEILADS